MLISSARTSSTTALKVVAVSSMASSNPLSSGRGALITTSGHAHCVAIRRASLADTVVEASRKPAEASALCSLSNPRADTSSARSCGMCIPPPRGSGQ